MYKLLIYKAVHNNNSTYIFIHQLLSVAVYIQRDT